MARDPQVARLISAYRNSRSTIRERTKNVIGASWRSLDSWRGPDIDAWVRLVTPVVEGAQMQTSSLTAAYLARLDQLVTGTPARPTSIPARLVNDLALRGVPTADVYSRMGLTIWTALSEGRTLTEGVAEATKRLATTIAVDLQLSSTHTAREVATTSEQRIVGSRRVLDGSESCGLCIVASTQLYRPTELMAIHPGCNCDVELIYSDWQFEQSYDLETLDNAHDAIAERFGGSDAEARDVPGATNPVTDLALQYRDVLVTHEHGELGPVLGVRGQDFTGPDDI